MTPILARALAPIRYGPSFAKTVANRPQLVLRKVVSESRERPVLTLQSAPTRAPGPVLAPDEELAPSVDETPVARASHEDSPPPLQATEPRQESLLSRAAGAILRVFRPAPPTAPPPPPPDSGDTSITSVVSRSVQPEAPSPQSAEVDQAQLIETEYDDDLVEEGLEEGGDDYEDQPTLPAAGDARPALSLRLERPPSPREAAEAPMARPEAQLPAPRPAEPPPAEPPRAAPAPRAAPVEQQQPQAVFARTEDVQAERPQPQSVAPVEEPAVQAASILRAPMAAPEGHVQEGPPPEEEAEPAPAAPARREGPLAGALLALRRLV
ncbi:MAG TPA: hypothetical protein VNN10_10625, partial [Dehalococcoidia bacterium]|nr:hypothetical protein [Dehalococcoidia bacterium]